MRLVAPSSDLSTFVAQRTKDGLFLGHDGSVWLYGIIPNDALQWEDADVKQAVTQRWLTMLTELGGTSRLGAPGLRQIRRNSNRLREIHILRVTWDERVRSPRGTPPDLAAWQEKIFLDPEADIEVRGGRSIVAVGVKLRRSLLTTTGVKAHLSELVESVVGHEVDLSSYNTDRSLIHEILKRGGAHVPSREESHRLEFWWNGGQDSMGSVTASLDGRWLACPAWPEGLEFAAIIDFENAQLDPNIGLWLNDVFSANEGCVCVSIRADVYPASGVNALFRKTRRKARTAIEENMATGDVDRGEDEELAMAARSLEDYYRETGEPVLRSTSLLFARQASEESHTYRDHLQVRWGLDTKILEHRQRQAFHETLPCGQAKFRFEKPFAQDISIGAVATSGITSFSEAGDEHGAWMGMAISDSTPIWLNPMGAPEKNLPPAMAVVGEPGSGKTFILQSLATQFAKGGHHVVYINPKPADSLSGFCHAIGGEVIKMSSSASDAGRLDPFRYARKASDAALIAISHIQSVIDLDQMAEMELEAGIMRAANSGARCVWDALQNEKIPHGVREMIENVCEGRPLFAQGIAMEPLPPLSMIDSVHASAGLGSLTLVEFDRQLVLPSDANKSYQERDERISMAAVRLVCSVALESMLSVGGGVLIVDEAHVLMGSAQGRQIITRLGREGRSQRILPILATQLLADVLEGDANMETYLSRVLGLKMRDKREMRALLDLLRLEHTEERMEFLMNAGPVRGVRGAQGLFRDADDRVSGVYLGPFPKHVEVTFSTNPLDRAERTHDAGALAGEAG